MMAGTSCARSLGLPGLKGKVASALVPENGEHHRNRICRKINPKQSFSTLTGDLPKGLVLQRRSNKRPRAYSIVSGSISCLRSAAKVSGGKTPVADCRNKQLEIEICASRSDEANLQLERGKLDEGKRWLGQLLLAATLLSTPLAPPPAEALQFQVLPEANIVGVAATKAAGVLKSVQQNKVLEKAGEAIEAQVQGMVSPEVREFLKQTLPSPSAISSDVNSGIQTLEASLESVKTSAEQLAAGLSFSEGGSPDLKTLEASLSSLAGGVSADPELQRNLQSWKSALKSQGNGLVQLLQDGLSQLQTQLAGVREQLGASGSSSTDQPTQNALSKAQDSVDAALTYLGNVAGDALNVVPLRSPSLTAAAQGTLQRLGLFELWVLVSGFVISQAERLVIVGPGLVLLAAGWNEIQKRERERRRIEKRLQGPSPEARLRSVCVQRELTKLRVKGQLFEAVRRLGRAALAPSTDSSSAVTRQEVESLVKQLKDLRTGPESALLGASSSDPFADLSPAPDIEGKWELTYSSEPLDTRGLSPGQLTDLLPDFAMDSILQRVTSRAQGSGSTGVPQPAPVRFAENSARVTLGQLGTFQISVQGQWEDHEDDTASVSFESFSANPVELFGRKLDGVPQVQLPVPGPLRQSVEWSTVYVDEDTRINQNNRGTFYLFRRLSG